MERKKRKNRQYEVYEFIEKFVDENGYSPTVRDIMRGLGYKSTSTIQYYIKRLEDEGKIRRTENRNRTLTVNRITSESRRLPVIGKVAAGIPILAVENIEEYYDIPESLFKGEELFLLKVKGDSMTGAGIFNDDIIVVNAQADAVNNDIVVALIDDDVTVKRIFFHQDHITLHAENPNYLDINVSDNTSILGKVIGSIRKF